MDFVVSEGPAFQNILPPSPSATVDVYDPDGNFVTSVSLGTPVSIPDAATGMWTVVVRNANTHYVIDKTSGADTGVYLNWMSFGGGSVSVSVTQDGQPYLGGYRVEIFDLLTGQGGGEYSVRVVTDLGLSSDTATVEVTCDGRVQITLDLPLLPVNIDLNPGSFPNSINLNGNGVQAVALFGTPGFDGNDVDVSTVLFGVDGDNAAPVHGGHVKDVNGDDILDIVSHFRGHELGIALNTPGNTIVPLLLTGALNDGTLVEGTDIARITPNNIDKSRGKGGKGPK